MLKGHFGPCRDILGHEGIFWVMKFLHCRAILGHEWPFLVMKGHYGAVLGHFGVPMGLCKGPRVVQNDTISCNIPNTNGKCFRAIWGHVRTFGAMKSNFGDILGHLGAVLGHFGAPVGL